MNYLYYDGVQAFMCVSHSDNTHFQEIIDTTVESWQKNRTNEEKTENTKQGKNAERAFELYVKEYEEFVYVPYDEFRNDGFKKSAPFDGLLYKKSKTNEIDKNICIERILQDVENSTNGQINTNTRKMLRNYKIYTLEIKSTNAKGKKDKLQEKDKNNKSKLITFIKKDDFLIYPFFCRTSDTIVSIKDYFLFVKENNLISWKDEDDFIKKMFIEEYENASDIQVRVYHDHDKDAWYLMGYMLAYDILVSPHIKKFRQEGKSEKAVYFTHPLKNGKSLNLLFSDSSLWDCDVYNIPYGFKQSQQLDEYISSQNKEHNNKSGTN